MIIRPYFVAIPYSLNQSFLSFCKRSATKAQTRCSMLDPGYWILYQHRRSSIEDRASSIMY
ncbi:MAG: hypothetical protein AB1797_02525 [bacterium]